MDFDFATEIINAKIETRVNTKMIISYIHELKVNCLLYKLFLRRMISPSTMARHFGTFVCTEQRLGKIRFVCANVNGSNLV